MTLALSLQARQTQTQALVITPQLMQAIRLLQMSGAELERFIDGELEKNPLLARDESGERNSFWPLSGEKDMPRMTAAPLPVAGPLQPAFRSQASADDLPDFGALTAPEMSLPARCEIAIDAAFPA